MRLIDLEFASAKIGSLPTHVLEPIFESLQREFQKATESAAAHARAGLLQDLNQLFRRLRGYQTESDWVQATLDGASAFAAEAAVFALENTSLRLRGQHPAGHLPDDLVLALSSAGAFASAAESKDPVTALRTPGEVTAALSEGHADERAHIFPIMNGSRVSAFLFVSGTGSDMNALELVAGIASSVLERKSNIGLHAQIASAPAAPVVVPEAKMPAWNELSADMRQLHIRAQRFARVAIAEIQLSRPEACRAGREQGNLYLFLKREIEKARENYRRQFMTVPSMVDYLHLELIQIAAEGDEQKLGVDYPGRLL